jgi:ABC-type ATPase with predicted acetyltransferase domain
VNPLERALGAAVAAALGVGVKDARAYADECSRLAADPLVRSEVATILTMAADTAEVFATFRARLEEITAVVAEHYPTAAETLGRDTK